VLAARSPRVLHLDAPGFFLPDPPGGPGPWESPLARSGLELAGERLTSYEITGLDLGQTELVVLPGVGSPSGELPRWGRLSALAHALLRAGARSVLLRLWRDEWEGALPGVVYRHLGEGKGLGEALRLARAGDVREWGAWVCVGEAGA